jgi:hypothetical protein
MITDNLLKKIALVLSKNWQITYAIFMKMVMIFRKILTITDKLSTYHQLIKKIDFSVNIDSFKRIKDDLFFENYCGKVLNNRILPFL